MRSHQKTWRDVNNYIPEKGTASLRESLKTMRSNNSPIENKKSSFMKKTNLPTNPAHALEQLRVWAQLEKAEDSFANIFSVLKNSTPFTEEALKRRNIFMDNK
ncbi:unnamed protein product [Rhizophagus irregularis]|nr:unnamed protein product [Rhizophagus irregularis]